jgi:protein-S-isoprenylcysteine O-methyltransferase Ste14
MMRILDTVRYVLAFLVLATYPPALLLWLAIHPFAASWRHLGPTLTYCVLSLPVAGYVAGVWFFRDHLLGMDLGTNAITVALACISLFAASLVYRQRRTQLDPRTLSGMPELSEREYPGRLRTEGIYGRVRNPRYIELLLWVGGYSLFANHVGTYLAVVLSLPVMYLVVVLEERELRNRFGTPYEEYCRRVPRFIPKLTSQNRRHASGAK